GLRDTFLGGKVIAQEGSKHSQAKPMKGFSGAGVLEVVEDYIVTPIALYIP
ncbi:hypothetical protein A221_27932, partial [Pseudomonas syringae pv. actinidiae ICMP 18801]